MIEVDPRWYLPADYKVVLTHSTQGVPDTAAKVGSDGPGRDRAETSSVNESLAAQAPELNVAA